MTPTPASTRDRRVGTKMSHHRVRPDQSASRGDERGSRPVDMAATADLEEMDLNRLCDADSIKMF